MNLDDPNENSATLAAAPKSTPRDRTLLATILFMSLVFALVALIMSQMAPVLVAVVNFDNPADRFYSLLLMNIVAPTMAVIVAYKLCDTLFKCWNGMPAFVLLAVMACLLLLRALYLGSPLMIYAVGAMAYCLPGYLLLIVRRDN